MLDIEEWEEPLKKGRFVVSLFFRDAESSLFLEIIFKNGFGSINGA